MGAVLYFGIVISLVVLVIYWEIRILKYDPSISGKILFSIIPFILLLLLASLLYLGIDREVYLHSEEANMETGADGEYFNIVYRDNRKREAYIYNNNTMEFKENIHPSKAPIIYGNNLKGWKYQAENPGETWASMWLYSIGNGYPTVEKMVFYHLMIDSSYNIQYEEIEDFLPAFLPSDVFVDNGTKKVIISKDNKSIEISDAATLNDLHEMFQFVYGDNYMDNPHIHNRNDYHIEIYYTRGLAYDFYISEEGVMYGRELGPDYDIEIPMYCVLNTAWGRDIIFIPNETSTINLIQQKLDDLLQNY